jgi:GAF domain-containing protein
MDPVADDLNVLELLRRTCSETVEALDASAALFSRVIGDLLLELAESTKSGRTLQLGHEYLIPDYPLTQEVIVSGEARTVSLFDEDPDPMEAALLAELGFDSLLMLPVHARGECWGLVEVYAVGRRRFDQEDVSRAAQIVARAGELLGGTH